MIYRDEEWEHGMLCSVCERPFVEGDEIYGRPLLMTAVGIPAEEPVCPACWVMEVEAE